MFAIEFFLSHRINSIDDFCILFSFNTSSSRYQFIFFIKLARYKSYLDVKVLRLTTMLRHSNYRSSFCLRSFSYTVQLSFIKCQHKYKLNTKWNFISDWIKSSKVLHLAEICDILLNFCIHPSMLVYVWDDLSFNL